MILPQLFPRNLIFEEVTTEGRAFFLGPHGDQYVLRPKERRIDEVFPSLDFQPLALQRSAVIPLGEYGRTFSFAYRAIHYVDAIHSFDQMVQCSIKSQSLHFDEDYRNMYLHQAHDLQKHIRKKHLHILDSIEQFAVVRDYVSMRPDQIVEDLDMNKSP